MKASVILIFVEFIAAVYSSTALADFFSPCPRVFQYETNNTQAGILYGNIILSSGYQMEGIYLRLTFDKPSIKLGNWFGETTTANNIEYTIQDSKFRLMPNFPHNLRFFVNYDPLQVPPKLLKITVNNKIVCPEEEFTKFTSQVRAQTQPSVSTIKMSVRSEISEESSKTSSPEEFFQGDLATFKNNNNSSRNDEDASCGKVMVRPAPLITHGLPTYEGEFPWHAALYHSKEISLKYICGGSLITKNHIITAAHCFSVSNTTKQKTQAFLKPERLVIYLGKYYLSRWSNVGIQNKYALEIIIHPDFNKGKYFSNDLAVVKLSSAADITDYVRPVCLWDETLTVQTSIVNKIGTVIGWGFDENGEITDKLMKAKMNVVSVETCVYSNRDVYANFVSPTTYCAGFKNGTSVCNGDSGGGMIFPKQTSTMNNPVWQLRGVVSISVPLQNHGGCDPYQYVIFTDAAKYLGWIRDVTDSK